MRRRRILSRALLAASLITMAISLAYGLNPGHRYRTRLVDQHGTIDREALAHGDEFERKRALDEIETLLQNQEWHLASGNASDGFLFLSWVLLAIAYAVQSRGVQPHPAAPPGGTPPKLS